MFNTAFFFVCLQLLNVNIVFEPLLVIFLLLFFFLFNAIQFHISFRQLNVVII